MKQILVVFFKKEEMGFEKWIEDWIHGQRGG